MVELTNFQKRFLAVGQGQQVFTQHEFDKALAQARAEIIMVAVEATKQAIAIEREECARLAENCISIETLADEIRQRLSGKPH